MAFRTQALLATCLSVSLSASEQRYSVRHDRIWRSGRGALSICESGVSYVEQGRPKHRWSWSWDEIQQLVVTPRLLRVLTYEDSRLRLGRDREHRFELTGPGSFESAYAFLRERLDQRLVAAFALPERDLWWSVPAKQLKFLRGIQGELLVSSDGVVFRTGQAGASRTWRWRDLESVSRTGPFQLTLTTYERAVADYGGLKSFTFQLKRPLDEQVYRRLWLRLNQTKDLKLLLNYTERRKEE